MLISTLFVFFLAQAYARAFGLAQPDLPSSTSSELQWEGCGEAKGLQFECARIDVPMDQFSPEKSMDKTFSLPVIRLLSNNTDATEGKTIFLNPGGPGGSGVSFLRGAGYVLNKITGGDFHLLSFDPRGVNGSSPQASCFEKPGHRNMYIHDQPWDTEYQAGSMYTRAENRAQACVDIIGEYGAYINTPQTAADMNSILDAIGQNEMYYWGFSYGTTLGQTYAQLFPEKVKRLIIDGVSNLDHWYNRFFDQESLVDTDKTYAGFIEKCFEAKENCALYSISTKPFSSAAELKSHIDNYLLDLEEEPIPVYLSSSRYGAVTRRGIASNGIFAAMYRPVSWPTLANHLAELLTGNTTSAFTKYSDDWIAKVIHDESNSVVINNDNWKSGESAPLHGIKDIQNFSLSVPQVSTLISKYQGSDIYDRASWKFPKTHNFHPQYYPEFPRFKTANPILVLSTTVDPVCPLTSAKKAHNSFEGAGFLEQLSYGHCSISLPSLCTAKHVRRYFVEGVLPDEGSTCEVDREYFPAPSAKGRKAAVAGRSTISAAEAELLDALEDLAEVVVF